MLAAIGILAILSGACGGGDAESLTVSAAASLSDVLITVGERFREETGIEVAFNFGGSRAIARQIELGAPADVGFFAGADPMSRLVEAGQIEAGEVVEVLSNRLVVVAKAGSDAQVRSLNELASGPSARIAMADPDLAPAGQYARAALRNAGLWGALHGRLIPMQDVRAAAGAVASGHARYGLAYATDAAVINGVEAVLEVPEPLYPRIIYPAAVIGDSRHRLAGDRFLQFLTSDEAREIFIRHGFDPAR